MARKTKTIEVINPKKLAGMMAALYPVILYFLGRKAAEKGYFRMRAEPVDVPS